MVALEQRRSEVSEENQPPHSQPIEHRPASGDGEIREGACGVAQQVLHTGADIGGIAGGIAAAKVLLGGRPKDGGGTGGSTGGSTGGDAGGSPPSGSE
jgi:hypothetical protein